MIRAAADCGEDPDAPPPAELRLAWQAVSYHALPRAGGLLDQQAGLLTRMTRAYNTWLAFHAYRGRDLTRHAEWVAANPDLYAIVQRVNRMRTSEHA